MHLKFNRHGLQFFFLTILLATDGGSAPELPPGDVVGHSSASSVPLLFGREAEESLGARPLPPLPTEVRCGYFGYGGSGAESPSVAGFWEASFWLDLSFDSRQLKAIRKHIRNNPAWALWKLANPDMFVCRQRFRHPVFDPTLPWTACGDLTLLGNPFMVAVSLTRKKTLAALERSAYRRAFRLEQLPFNERSRRGHVPTGARRGVNDERVGV